MLKRRPACLLLRQIVPNHQRLSPSRGCLHHCNKHFASLAKLFFEEIVQNALDRKNGKAGTIMSTFIILIRSLSSELWSFPVPSAFGSTKLFKDSLVYQALSGRVVAADLSSDSRNQAAYSTGPTHYYFLSRNFYFMSHNGSIQADLLPCECKKGDTFPVVYLPKTDFGTKQGLTYIINTSPKTRVMLMLSNSSRINISNVGNNIRDVKVSHPTMVLRQLEPYTSDLLGKKQYAFAIVSR